MNLDNVNDDYIKFLFFVEEVYGYIVQDLIEVEVVLFMGYSGSFCFLNGVNVYVIWQVVKFILVVVYMVMVGWLMNKMEYYVKVVEKVKEVIEGVNRGEYEYKFDKDYKDVYVMSNNYNNEMVFGINYLLFVDWVQDLEFILCNQFELLGGWGDVWGEICFWKEFFDGLRKDVIYDFKICLKDGMLVDWWELKEDGIFVVLEYYFMFSIFFVNWDFVLKVNISVLYDYIKLVSQNMCNDYWYRIICYLEVLLWYVEVKVRMGQMDELVFKCLNDVCKCVGLELFIGFFVDDFVEVVYKEYGWEVVGYWVVFVICCVDQFCMNRLKDIFKERVENMVVEVVDGILVKEFVEYMNRIWSDNLMYFLYFDMDFQKNLNLVR